MSIRISSFYAPSTICQASFSSNCFSKGWIRLSRYTVSSDIHRSLLISVPQKALVLALSILDFNRQDAKIQSIWWCMTRNKIKRAMLSFCFLVAVNLPYQNYIFFPRIINKKRSGSNWLHSNKMSFNGNTGEIPVYFCDNSAEFQINTYSTN